MVLGLSISAFTQVHVAISLVAIAAGIIALFGMIASRRMPAWTAVFLLLTILTSVTGFLFPISVLTPALILGAISLVVLAVAVFARYGGGMRGAWRWIYVIAATAALYFNVFVLVVQSFQKIPVLQVLAPAQTEPPFVATQAAALAVFVVLGALATFRFRPHAAAAG